jgi:hypothetical protein
MPAQPVGGHGVGGGKRVELARQGLSHAPGRRSVQGGLMERAGQRGPHGGGGVEVEAAAAEIVEVRARTADCYDSIGPALWVRRG